jgi:UDPglucose--hexose-1-phosphate uridylyltransferase
MPELRYNIITREWVIIATERAKRPEQFASRNTRRSPQPAFDARCPFCPGNEAQTPPETYRIGDERTWHVRAVPNKFAALSSEGELARRTDGLKRTISGVGRHEVIIETPVHNRQMAQFTAAELERAVQAYVRRYEAVTADPRIAHATLFRNHGERAGTSLEHPHAQIVGTPIIPPQVRERMETALRFFDENGRCIFCNLLEEELTEGRRLVAENERFVAFLPFAALTPFHLWIFPRRHTAGVLEASDAELADFAALLGTVLRKVRAGLEDPDYNLTLRTPPREAQGMRYFHWYASLIPRVTRVAGFEIGSGMFINTSLPEQSAEFLRAVADDTPPTAAG